MLLWVMFAVMTAAVLAVVLRPAFKADAAVQAAEAADLSVYLDQLADLDRQRAQGRIDEPDYQALHNEIARRILRSDKGNAPHGITTALITQSRTVALSAAAVVPAACLGLYLDLGAPSVPARPFAANPQAVAQASAAELVSKVEARLAANPDDVRGWELIAPVYFKLERFADAASAYGMVLRMAGETPQRLAGFAEATVMANDGIVTDAARSAYEKLAAASPERFEPRFWLALAKEQDGQREAAASDYRDLLAAAPPSAPWRTMVEQQLAKLSAAPPPRGPTAADVSAAAAMSPAERSAMIASMVDGLAARLKSNGQDADGWQRLISAYATLKQPEKARAALADGRAALASDKAALAKLDGLARTLDLVP